MRKKKNRAKRKAPGLPPGALIYTGNQTGEKANITAIQYSHDTCNEYPVKSVDALKKPDPEADGVLWVNLDGLYDVESISEIGKTFGIHNLILEDILNIEHRPKAEEFDDFLFFTLKMLDYAQDGTITSEQVSIVLGKNYLISFQERPGDVFDPIRERIRTGKVREKKADYLSYILLDAVVDRYYLIIDQMATKMEDLENQIIQDTKDEMMFEIQEMKTHMVELRRSIYPLREAVGYIEKCGDGIVNRGTLRYFHDLYDHIIQVIDQLDSYREVLGSLQDLFHSMVSNKMNNIMKVLTIMASIFIPLTFVAGIYGMNFEHMPELHYKYGYILAWGVMVVMALGMIWYFRKKKWF
ncbi:MAG: magnesium/cobalt transporter CorA [Flavobacteriales bacterium]|nr:magnesium/cobalt transporter CorA [Flavobacteriales bacterium]